MVDPNTSKAFSSEKVLRLSRIMGRSQALHETKMDNQPSIEGLARMTMSTTNSAMQMVAPK